MAHFRVPSLPPPPASASLKESFSPNGMSPVSEQQQLSNPAASPPIGGPRNAPSTSQSVSSPANSSSDRAGPQVRKFDMVQFKTQLQKLCHAHLAHGKWDAGKAKEWSGLLGEAAKQKMLEQEPKGYKYIVSVSLSQNLGQQGRGDAQTHWDPNSDSISGLVWSNDSMIATILAIAIRTAY